MHQTALDFATLFFKTYRTQESAPKITEIGSYDVNGSIRSVAPSTAVFTGLDCQPGPGVDIVLEDPYSFPLESGSQDIVVSSSCFEHVEMFWLVFLEALRILRPNGILYLNAPSNGDFHRYPIDAWRFYPDSGRALAAWGRRSGFNTILMESLIGPRPAGGVFNDFVAVFLRDAAYLGQYPNRMISILKTYGNGSIDEAYELRAPISRW